jgi:hypothetical protein
MEARSNLRREREREIKEYGVEPKDIIIGLNPPL